MLDLNRNPEILIFDKDKVNPEPLNEYRKPTLSVVLQPDIKGESKLEEAVALTEYEGEDNNGLEIRTLGKYMSGTKCYLIYALVNRASRGRQILTYFYGYDKSGRLVTSRKESRHLSSMEQHIATFSFYKTGREVRWVIKATFRK